MFTIYNDEENRLQKVEEPDHSLHYTYADYIRWKFEERLELLKGKIFPLSAPNTKHQRVSMKLGYDLYRFLKGKTCQVFLAPFDVRLPVKDHKKDDEIDTVVQPDICVICDASKLDDRGACGAPDLVVEVLSPGNSKKEVRLKFDLYEQAGVKEYWIVNPMQESVMVVLLQEEGRFGPAKIYKDDDSLQAASVPGFSINTDQLFTQ